MKFRDFDADTYGYRPHRPDGTDWAHVMVLHDTSTVRADTAREVVEELIDGYAALPDEAARLEARIRHAEQTAAKAQDVAIDKARSAGRFDPGDPDDASILPILQAPKDTALVLELEDAPGEQADWVAAVDLVLVTTSYAPHTAVAPIGGRVTWLDPSEDGAYLRSLHAARLYDYWTSED